MVASPEICRINGAKSRGPITQRGKAIASRNSTKHGLLAEKPPILASEDLETFQGLVQSLVDYYQPEGAVEWHCVQTIAMCIQRQHRLWAAEVAVGNDQMLPPVAQPYTEEKYPLFKQPEKNEHWSNYHPANLLRERKLLTTFLEHNTVETFPTERRSKYFEDMWKEWVAVTMKYLERLEDEYPTDGIPGKPDRALAVVSKETYVDRFDTWLADLKASGHPFAECWFYRPSLQGAGVPKTKFMWDYYFQKYVAFLAACRKRIEQINQVEQEIEQERDLHQQDLAQRQALTASPIPSSVVLLNRYESHISKQLERAIEQLQNLQNQRKNEGSMGSFG